MIARSVVVGFALLIAASTTGARAEVIGPLLPKAAFEAGLQSRYVDREIYYRGAEEDVQQSELAIIGRWGVTEFATLSFELSPGSGKIVGGFNGSTISYVVGAGIQATVFRNDHVRSTASYQITMTMHRIEDYPDPNAATESHTGELMLEGTLKLWDGDFNWFAGPAYSVYYFSHEATIGRSEEVWYSESNFGGVAGFNWVLWDHLNIASHLLWVENPQPRVALLYRF